MLNSKCVLRGDWLSYGVWSTFEMSDGGAKLFISFLSQNFTFFYHFDLVFKSQKTMNSVRSIKKTSFVVWKTPFSWKCCSNFDSKRFEWLNYLLMFAYSKRCRRARACPSISFVKFVHSTRQLNESLTLTI